MSSIVFLCIVLLIFVSNSQSYQYCYPVTPPENGFVDNSENNRYYTFSCENGFSLNGPMYIYCDEYDPKKAPKCIKHSLSHQNCPPVSPPEHGSVEPIEYYKLYQFSCEDGYTLKGSTYISCGEYNSKPKPECISHSQSREYCYEIPPPEHGLVEIDEFNRHYKFSCEDGYTLHGATYISCEDYDSNLRPNCIKHVCEDLPNPQNGQVDCAEGPLVPGKNCRFSCSKGYRLQGTLTRICKFNLQWSGSAECYPLPNVCQTPDPPENGAVECDKGDLILGKACNFSCSKGYKLQGASVRRCMVNYKWSGKVQCVPVPENSEVESADHDNGVQPRTGVLYSQYVTQSYSPSSKVITNNGCHNHQCEQLCRIEKNGPHCRCCGGYKLNTDNITCRVNDRSRINHECVKRHSKKTDDVKVSPCPKGYTLDKEKRSCIDIDECQENNFGCSDRCVNIPGRAYCTCPRGFVLGVDGKTCNDVDECSYEGRCQHYCNNTEGSYFCSCKPGYLLMEGYKCLGCKRNSYWSYEKDGCVDCPKNSHTKSEGKRSIEDCVCNSGYTGNPSEFISCQDNDECSINNFGCSNTCINIPGSAYCICPKGFKLDTDNKTCVDIDECSIKNGGCEGLCRNTNGSFECSCQEGLVASKSNRYSCDDINECSENNGGCGHVCINYRGGFYCACKPGYRLDSTLKNCTDIQCPKLSQPHYSQMNCTYREPSNQTWIVLPESDSYSAGTKCTFKCYKGFKNTRRDNKLKCGKDGTWFGTLPECKSESCTPLNVPENGKIHPSSCSIYGATVKGKCAFSCHSGYTLEGYTIFECNNDLTWNKKNIPICKLEKIQPTIKCPQDIQVVLTQGVATHNITVREPTANMEYYEVHPPWVTINEPVEFQVGETKITFTTVSPFNETAQCEMAVTVLDEEPPIFHFCPDPIIIEGAGASGEYVTWDEPVVTDNVELVSVFSLLEPNTTLSPGTYFVEYVARDSSGNIGTCSFDISIIRMNCSDLGDPVHGKANCMDWMYGKLCNPECDAGYMRDPEDALYYSCDDTGVWEPNDSIGECLKYTPATSPACRDGFEFKKVDITEEEVCIECSSNTVWSAATRKCENK